MNLNDLFTEEKVRLDPKCWTGKKIGNPKTKMKGGVRVNNCVPAESVNEMDKSQTPPGRDGSNDPDAGKKEYTAKTITPKKVVKHAEKILNKELNKKQGVAEGSSDTIYPNAEVIKSKNGKPVGEIYQDGNSWGAFHYRADRGYDFIDSREDAIEALRDLHQETGRSRPDYTIKGVAEGSGPEKKMTVGQALEIAKKNNSSFTAKDYYDLIIRNEGLDSSFFNSEVMSAIQKKQGVAEGELDEKSTSQAQFRTMAAAAHNPEFAKKVGISRDVAKEFHGADRKQDYADLPKKADESKSAPKEKEADYGDDYQAMVARVKKLAGLGPLKTVYDPQKRVYRNIPTAQQPKK
jgi:hypothetical protein